jgi:hypothetical protein
MSRTGLPHGLLGDPGITDAAARTMQWFFADLQICGFADYKTHLELKFPEFSNQNCQRHHTTPCDNNLMNAERRIIFLPSDENQQ